MKLIELLIESQEELAKKYNITKFEGCGLGLDEDKGIWYGWSHRAVCGFKIGDKIFDEDYVEDKLKDRESGENNINTLEYANPEEENVNENVT